MAPSSRKGLGMVVLPFESPKRCASLPAHRMSDPPRESPSRRMGAKSWGSRWVGLALGLALVFASRSFAKTSEPTSSRRLRGRRDTKRAARLARRTSRREPMCVFAAFANPQTFDLQRTYGAYPARTMKDLELNLSEAIGKEELVATSEKIRDWLESGEMSSVALRVFKSDGTWEDIALGDDKKERAQALAALHAAYANAH